MSHMRLFKLYEAKNSVSHISSSQKSREKPSDLTFGQCVTFSTQKVLLNYCYSVSWGVGIRFDFH